jgi:hypothetical protein
MTERERGVDLDDFMHEAEAKFRKSVETLNDWGHQAREVLEKRPGAVLAGAAILGFVTGLLLRRAATGNERRQAP